jgi:hypothetical protein
LWIVILPKRTRLTPAVGQFNATDPDLSAFRQRGGKILQYHGWNDQFIAPQSSVNYYESVVTRVDNRRATEDFYRLFMVPGMMHCQGGGQAMVVGRPCRAVLGVHFRLPSAPCRGLVLSGDSKPTARPKRCGRPTVEAVALNRSMRLRLCLRRDRRRARSRRAL